MSASRANMGAADLASGKGHTDENFPVASVLIAPAFRAPIMAFYRFARLADDIADHETAPPAEKLARLEAMRAGITGESDAEPSAVALRTVMAERGLDPSHALDLLEAFRRDVTKLRTDSWDDLMDYCRYSAMPVGRFVLDVHGEDRASYRGAGRGSGFSGTALRHRRAGRALPASARRFCPLRAENPRSAARG
jgi:phytoene/squalene synthetase